MVRVALRMLRQRPAAAIATYLALWFAVAMVTACGVMLESGIRYHGAAQRYAGSTLLVATTDLSVSSGSGEDRSVERYPLSERARVDTSLVHRIASLPGVRLAAADVAAPGRLAVGAGSPAYAVSAHPWSTAALTPFTLRAGRAPTTNGEAVVDARLAATAGVTLGEQIRLTAGSGTTTFRVSGIVAAATAALDQRTVFVDDSEAEALAGHPGRAEVIGVVGEPGVDRTALATSVAATLPPTAGRPASAYPRVYVGPDRGVVESPDVADGREFAIAVSSVFGGATLLIAILVIAGTVGLSVKQRHRDIALLRAIAATPRQVRRLVVREAVVLGLLAGVTGVWSGLAAIGWLRGQFVTRGMVPDTFAVHVSWLPPVVAASATLLIAVVAAWLASWRVSRIRPTEALGEWSVERPGIGVIRALLGVVALAGGIVLSSVAMNARGDSAAGTAIGVVFTFVVAVALLSPVLIRLSVAIFGVALRGFGVTGRLAAAHLTTSARRLSPVLSALVLAVALGGSLWFLPTSQQHTAAAQRRAGLLADLVVTPSAPGLQPGQLATIRRTGGVLAATGVTHSTMFTSREGDTVTVQGVDPVDLARTIELAVTSGSLVNLHGRTIALDSLTAQALRVRVGDEFHGWFGDGAPAVLRIVAIYRRGLGFAELTVPRDVLSPHTTTNLVDTVFVTTTAAARPHVDAALSADVGRFAPGSSVLARDDYQAELDKDLAANGWTNQFIVGVMLVYVVIAAVNTLVMAALGRRRELAILRLTGVTRIQVLRMVRMEQALLVGLAMLVGGAIAAATLVPMVKGTTGTATPYIPPAGWAAVVGGTVVLAAAATMLPVRRVLRMRPIEAIGIRE